jgi:hypothetical protein
MTVLIRESRRAATVYDTKVERARLSVPRGMVPVLPDGRLFSYNGTPINAMLSLSLRDDLRKRCIDGAKQWVRRRSLDGMSLLTAESDVKVFGPYRSRAGTYGSGKQPVVTAYGEDEDFNDDLADFVFEATFLTTRHRPVQTKAEA